MATVVPQGTDRRMERRHRPGPHSAAASVQSGAAAQRGAWAALAGGAGGAAGPLCWAGTGRAVAKARNSKEQRSWDMRRAGGRWGVRDGHAVAGGGCIFQATLRTWGPLRILGR